MATGSADKTVRHRVDVSVCGEGKPVWCASPASSCTKAMYEQVPRYATSLASLPPVRPAQVALWDLRNMTSKLHLFERHDEEVFQVGRDGRGLEAAAGGCVHV